VNAVQLGAAEAVVRVIVLAIILGSGATWAVMGYRLWRRRPVLPYEPHRQVPWRLIDLLSVFLVYALLTFWMVWGAERWFHVKVHAPARAGPAAEVPTKMKPPQAKAAGQQNSREVDHPVFVILRSRPDAATLLFCLVLAGVVVPIAEEMTFRLLLQGWLEAAERHWRRRIDAWRSLARGAVPVVLVSAIFAAGHYRTAGRLPDVESLLYLLGLSAAAEVVALSFAVWLIWYRRGATCGDFGLVPQKFWSDVRLGLLAYLAWVPPVLLIQNVAMQLLPKWLAPDPIALFVFALVLGTLYLRTHRIVSSIVLHMSLNTTSLLVTWLTFAE
jgi:membrane protease YdiL (CAAX protease family)